MSVYVEEGRLAPRLITDAPIVAAVVPGAPKARAEYPLVAESLTTISYFEQREKFNLLGLIMNPSFLTIVVPIGLLYILPKLSQGMMGACISLSAWCLCNALVLMRIIDAWLADPEEFKKAQEEMGTQNPGDLLSGILGGAQNNAEDSDDD